MELGFIRAPDLHIPNERHMSICDALMLTESAGYASLYLPRVDPVSFIERYANVPVKRLSVGFDATSISYSVPSDMNAILRQMERCLHDRLTIGVEMCGARSSVKSRMDAQNFEALLAGAAKSFTSNLLVDEDCRVTNVTVLGLPFSGDTREITLSASRGYRSLSPSWLTTSELARHWPAHVVGATSALRPARLIDWHVARTVFVHEDPTLVENYVFGESSPIRAYYTHLARHRVIGPDVERVMREVVLAGSSVHVAERLLALRERVGAFGTLHIMDHIGHDADLTRQSLIDLAEVVLPHVMRGQAVEMKELEKT